MFVVSLQPKLLNNCFFIVCEGKKLAQRETEKNNMLEIDRFEFVKKCLVHYLFFFRLKVGDYFLVVFLRALMLKPHFDTNNRIECIIEPNESVFLGYNSKLESFYEK